MALYVGIVLDLYDGSGARVTRGAVQFTPTQQLTDVPDQQIITQGPVTGIVGLSPSPQVQLLAPDNPGPQPPGWAWQVTFSGIPGAPAPYAIQPFAGPAAFTATSATPCVFTWTPTAHLTSLPNGTGVQLSVSFGPFAAGTMYYIVNASGTTFELAATTGGSPIASTSTGSGELSVVQFNLSALSPVSSVTTMAPFMPLPSGTPSAGQAPIATGSGEASAWGSVATNPMTTSGDTVYGGASGAITRLPGDTSNTRKFLREQSTSGTAQPPAWDTLQTGDIPSLPYAPLASPAFTGTPTAPTATALTDNTQVATTAYTDTAVAVETSRAETAEALKAPLASPAFTGSPTAPTQAAGDTSTKLATDAFVAAAAAAATAYFTRVFAV